MPIPDPPRSRIAERVREDRLKAAGAGADAAGHLHPSFRRKLHIRLAATLRWLHIYLSLFSLAIVLFFSLTGITLNHPDWFFNGVERSVEKAGKMNGNWLHAEPSRDVDKLAVVEHLRREPGARGAVAEFRTDETECTVSFKGPGYSADAFIERESGAYKITETSHGFIAVINDLHKGRDTGKAWSLLIDVSAVLLTVLSLTGLALLFYLKLRRKPGLAVVLIGAVVAAAVYYLGVP